MRITKKIMGIICISITALIFFSNPSYCNSGGVVVISEKMFLTQINDVYYNFGDYKGRTIRVEGMFDCSRPDPRYKTKLKTVYRRGPGCCGNDGWGGFLLKYKGKSPKNNSWVEVEGKPILVKKGRFPGLYLKVSKLTVKSVRGKEFVVR